MQWVVWLRRMCSSSCSCTGSVFCWFSSGSERNQSSGHADVCMCNHKRVFVALSCVLMCRKLLMSHDCIEAADWLRAAGVSSAERQRHRAECLKDSQTRPKPHPQTRNQNKSHKTLCSVTISLFTCLYFSIWNMHYGFLQCVFEVILENVKYCIFNLALCGFHCVMLC